MNDQSNAEQQQGGQSGAGYGDHGDQGGQQGGGMDSSAGTGSTGDMKDRSPSDGQSGAGYGDQMSGDQSVQRSETIEAEDIEFEADDDLIDDDAA